MSDRAWVAHCIYPDDDEVRRLGAAGVGVAHCPSSNMMIGGGGIAPVAELRAAGSPVGLGCDGSASSDHASLWLEARGALLLDRHASPNAIEGSLDVIADALGERGVRSVLCYEVSDRDGAERGAAGIEENLRFLGQPRPLARAMVGAHAPFTLSDDTRAACADAARGARVGVHIHVAEDAADERDAEARCGRRTVERLHGAGLIDDRARLAHCVEVRDGEMCLVAQSAATVVCNPRSNMSNGVGHSPFNRGEGRVALGTDGIDGDMFAETEAGFFRTREADLSTPAGWPLNRLAESARFAGRVDDEPPLGTLQPGAPADVVVLDYPQPTPLTAGNLAGHWVFGLSAARVRDVYVAGEIVVADHRSTRIDEADVAATSTTETALLWQRLEAVPAHPFTPMGDEHR